MGPHTVFTSISVKCEMGNVVNALDVAWSIASRGIVSGNFAKQVSVWGCLAVL